MLSALQRFTLRKWFKSYATKAGVDPQTVDFEALVDPQLSYAENKTMFQGLVLLPPDELAYTEQARAMEEQYKAHILEQRNRAFHRLEEMFRTKPQLGHPAFRQEPKTLEIWLRITDIRRVDVARAFLRKWGVRFEYRHATYQFKLKNSFGKTFKRNVQRCPPLFGVRMPYNLIGSLQDRLRDAGVNTVISGVQQPPFLGCKSISLRLINGRLRQRTALTLAWVEKLATIAFDIPKELRDFLEVTSGILEECDVSISPSSLQIRAMDPSHIAMLDLAIREEGMEDTAVKTRVILPMIAKAVKAGLTHLSYDTESQKITMNGGARKFTIPTLQVQNGELPEIKIPDWDVENLSLNVSELKAGAGLAPTDNVRITGDGKEIVATLNGDLTTYEATLGTYEGKAFKATFNYDYLSQVFGLTSASLGATQKWKFKNGFPAHASFSKNITERVTKDLTRQRSATLQYWLAPRIEQEDVAEAKRIAEAGKERSEEPVEIPAEIVPVEAPASA